MFGQLPLDEPMHELLREQWCKLAGQLQTEAELEASGRCVARGQPCGGEPWVPGTTEQRGLGINATSAAPIEKGAADG